MSRQVKECNLSQTKNERVVEKGKGKREARGLIMVGKNAGGNEGNEQMCIRLKWVGYHDTLRLKRSFSR